MTSGIRPRQQVANAIMERIVSGKISIGQRIPTELSLASEFNVSRGTVRQALQLLADRGTVELRRGVGGFVRESALEGIPRDQRERSFLLVHQRGRNVYSDILIGMEAAVHQVGGQLGLLGLSEDLEESRAALEARPRTASGGIVYMPAVQPNSYETNGAVLDLFERMRLRHVCIGTPVALNGAIRGDFVGHDGYSAVRAAVRGLVERGHRDIGSIRVFPGVYNSDHRYMGIIDELHASRLPLREEWHRIVDDAPLREQGRRRVREIMALPERPTALLCNHDLIAINVFDELRGMGLRVPEDMSLFGFDDTLYASLLNIASVRPPFADLCRRAVEFLLTPSESRRQEFLPCEVVFRSSIRTFAAGEQEPAGH